MSNNFSKIFNLNLVINKFKLVRLDKYIRKKKEKKKIRINY